MAMLTADDIRDKILHPYAVKDTSYLDDADNYFKSFANSLGVYTTQIKTSPLPLESKRLMVCFVCIEICNDNIGTNINKTENGFDVDQFKIKKAEWEKELTKAKEDCTDKAIMGIAIDNLTNTNETRSNTFGRA
jgi:hypothetical protein